MITTTPYPDDYFDINQKILKIAALWYSKSESWLYQFFCLFCFLYCVVFCTPSEFVSLLDTWGNINAFSMNMGIALTHGIASLKIINWFIRRDKILQMMQILQGDNLKYKATSNFDPGLLVAEAKQTNITLSKMFFLLANLIPVSSYVLSIFNFFFYHESYYSTDKNGELTYCKTLPFFSWIPFDRSTKWTCFLAIIFQSFPFTYLTVMIVAMDTLYMGLINYLTAHLKILQGAFRTIRIRALMDLDRTLDSPLEGHDIKELYDDDILENMMMKHMKKCINHFQTIQRLWENMEEVYSLQTLGQVLVSLFVLCTCLFLISTVPVTSKTFFVEVLYIIAIEYQLTLYCWFGNELTLAGLGLSRALYESDWLSASPRFKKSMLITMLRLERPLILTIGKFTPLTLNTLVVILRGSYSLYAVLKNSNSIQEK